eukprot:4286794-Pyramimonas_sp.AAC.1
MYHLDREDWAKNLVPLWERLRTAAGSGLLFDPDYSEYLHTFRLAARPMGAPNPAPCRARHSGPSVGRDRGSRSSLEGQWRGQWKSSEGTA